MTDTSMRDAEFLTSKLRNFANQSAEQQLEVRRDGVLNLMSRIMPTVYYE